LYISSNSYKCRAEIVIAELVRCLAGSLIVSGMIKALSTQQLFTRHEGKDCYRNRSSTFEAPVFRRSRQPASAAVDAAAADDVVVQRIMVDDL